MEENCCNALPLRFVHPENGGIYYNNVADACYYSEDNPSSYFASNDCPEYLMSSSPWISSQSQQQEAPPSYNYFQFSAENGQTSLNPSPSSGFREMPTQIDTDKVGGVKLLDHMENLSNFSNSEYLDPNKVMLMNKSANEDYDNTAMNLSAKVSQSSASSAYGFKRRKKIKDGLEAMHEFLPHKERGRKEAILDDVIDYVKRLQFQIKELSQSKPGGESSGTSYVLHEGRGHYPHKNQMQDDSLDELMVKLLEVNPFAATQLLESKGLAMMPITLAEGIHPDV